MSYYDLLEEVELVLRVVDEVDTTPARNDGESKQRAATCGRDQGRRRLGAMRCRLDDISVATVRGEDVTVGGERKSEWDVQRTAGSHGHSNSCARVAVRRCVNSCNAIGNRIGH